MPIARRALVEALGVAFLAACGFPDVSIASSGGVEGGAGMDAPVGDAGPGSDATDERATLDAPGDAVFDAVAQDAVALDAPPEGAPTCDGDGDGYLAMGAPCGGTDCCDTDRNAHPGQTQFFTSADACGSFDYDCDGKLEPEYATNLTCTGTGLTGCKGGPGFIGDPACGTTGPWAAACQGSGALACQPGSTTSQAQGCR